jgi:uncharacterized protein (DUF1800 family)
MIPDRLKHVLAAAALLSATAVAAAPLGFDDARHLLVRVGYGPTLREVQAFAVLTRQQAVDRLLAGARTAAQTPAPAWVDEPFEPLRFKRMSDEEKKAAVKLLYVRGADLRAWWLAEMLHTPSPLTERMTLFWHNHFVSSQQKVKAPQLMYRQNVLLRRYALGNFGDLLHAVAKDPAMLIYLDSASSRKGQPNENFAREVMELFTLGEGHYGESDIKEAARAFTGWSVSLRDGGDYTYRPFWHDGGTKTVLGRTGNFDGDQVLDILLAQRQTAVFITAKLWREFVSPTPDAAEVERIAAVFRGSGYDIRAVLRALLTSDAFYAPENRAALIKSPVDLVVGTLRQFEVTTGDPLPFALLTRQLGQDLFGPPNVKGWPGGDDWINSTTLLARKQFLERLFRAREMGAMVPSKFNVAASQGGAARGDETMRARFVRALGEIRFNSDAWLAGAGDAAAIERLVLATAPANPPAETGGLGLLRALTQDPAYQLK